MIVDALGGVVQVTLSGGIFVNNKLERMWTEAFVDTLRYCSSSSAVGWGTTLQVGRSWVWFPMVSLEFFIDIILRRHHGPGVDSASNRNEYQEYFPGVKAAGAYGWHPYHLHVPIVLKSGSPNLLEPSGPVQACNGIALPLRFTVPAFNWRYWEIQWKWWGSQYSGLNLNHTPLECYK